MSNDVDHSGDRDRHRASEKRQRRVVVRVAGHIPGVEADRLDWVLREEHFCGVGRSRHAAGHVAFLDCGREEGNRKERTERKEKSTSLQPKRLQNLENRCNALKVYRLRAE